MKAIIRLSLLSALLVLAGCAHPINIAPNVASVDRKDLGTKIPKNVGYYISAEDRAREVTTPGGGGDRVSYVPYRDLEPGLYRVLANSFSDVQVLKSPNDKDAKVALVFVPKITTDSSSSNPLTWPPTSFTVSIECKALSPSGAVVWEKTVKGEGAATFSEYASDFALSGRRASEKALLELQRQLLVSPALRN